MDEKDSIIVLSGGMDSVTLLYEFRANIALAVTFDYGSNHNRREIEFARMHCERLGIEHIVIPLDFMAKYFKSSLLEGAEAIPEGNYDDENMKSTVVPFRNGIMLAVACGLAESRGLPRDDCKPCGRPCHISRLPPGVCARHVVGNECRNLRRHHGYGPLHQRVED